MAASIALNEMMIMADLMKIGGVTGWMAAPSLADAAGLPVSSHIFVEASADVNGRHSNLYMVEWLDVLRAQYSPSRLWSSKAK